MPWFTRTAPGRQLSMPEFIQRVASRDLTLIDVRELDEVLFSGMAAGAHHVPMSSMPKRVDPRNPEHHPALDPDHPVALYCNSGARSHIAADMLRALGYAEVYNLGGLKDWTAAGGATTV